MSKRDLPKIDLALLKKLVAELETASVATHDLPIDKKEDVHHYVTEIAKASGLADAVAKEAGALVKDMDQLSRMAMNPMAGVSGENLLAELFGPNVQESLIVDPNKKNRN